MNIHRFIIIVEGSMFAFCPYPAKLYGYNTIEQAEKAFTECLGNLQIGRYTGADLTIYDTEEWHYSKMRKLL
jgi:hypothetical protein